MNYLRLTCLLTIALSTSAFSKEPLKNQLQEALLKPKHQSVTHLHNSDLATIYGGEDISKKVFSSQKVIA